MRCPKPARRGPKPRRRIERSVPVAKRSAKRSGVEKADAAWRAKVRKRSPDSCEFCGAWFGSFLGECHHLWPKGHEDMKSFRRWMAYRYPGRWSALERARRSE